MKGLDRGYVWWPGLSSDIESFVQQCSTCQESRPQPPLAPVHSWSVPKQPWTRIHLDFAGPFQGSMFLVLVDASTKWLDVVVMNSITSASTIEKLQLIFSTHGLPRTIINDRSFEIGDKVFVRDFRGPGVRWMAGEVTRITGPLSYHVKVATGVLRRHVDNIRQRFSEDDTLALEPTPDLAVPWPDNSAAAVQVPEAVVAEPGTESPDPPVVAPQVTTFSVVDSPSPPTPPEPAPPATSSHSATPGQTRRVSSRHRQPPDYYRGNLLTDYIEPHKEGGVL